MTLHSPRHRPTPTRLTAVALLAACAAFGVTLLTGCAGSGTPDDAPSAGTPSAAGSVTASPSGQASSPSTPATSPSVRPKPSFSGPVVPPPAKDEITLTGTVQRVDIEGGCLVLRVGSKSYELIGGDPVVLQHGNQVRVVGILRSDMATICQVGPVLDVVSSQPV